MTMMANVRVFQGGPGTGKTTKLIDIVTTAINGGTDPNSILLLTFGRERASQLRDEIAFKSEITALEPLARTFHALAFSILKAEGQNPILLSGPEQESFIRQLLEGSSWPTELEKAAKTRGFVRELRDLISRATERGWSYQDLTGEEFWPEVAKFWQSYQGAIDLEDISISEVVTRLDSSQLIWQAATLLKKNTEIRNRWQNRFKLILVDEYQECDKAQRALLQELVSGDLVIAVDRDSTVGRFRGADPEGIDQALDFFKPKIEELTENYRHAPEVFAAIEKTAGKFPGAKRKSFCTSKESGHFGAKIFTDVGSEAAYIADQIQRAYLQNGLKWSEIAIVLRTPAAAGAIRRALVRSGVPIASELQVIAENAALEPILLLAETAIYENLNYATAEKLLLSEIGGSDSVDLRRIRRALIKKYAEAENKSGSELIVSAIIEGGLEVEGSAALEKLHNIYLQARKVARDKTAQPEDLLWVIWNNSGLADKWRQLALSGGVRGAFADRDLDAAMQLFESARRYGARFKFGSKAYFFKDIRKAEIAGDVITARGARPDVVEILTPYTAKGRDWKFVVVAGIQEGIWPNLKVRGSLLGSDRLVERDRHPNLNRIELELVAKAAVAEDELRLFYVAISRAKNQLLITAVQNEESEPSNFFDLLCEEPEFAESPARLNSGAVIARLRRELVENKSKSAAATLKALAANGFASADPRNWYGASEITTTDSVVAVNDEVRISPSGIEKFDECELRWFLETNGGQGGNSTAQMIGNLIHKFAELAESEKTTFEEQAKLLETNWRLIDAETGWLSKTSQGRALLILRRFYQYREESNRTFVAAEKHIDFTVGRARIKGSIDRVEATVDGRKYLVDFKTGKSEITVTEAKTNAQMQLYQLALVKEGNEVDGASLVYLDHDNKGSKTRDQNAIDPKIVEARIELVAEKMGGRTFLAKKNKNCQFCQLKTSCPIQIEGRKLYE